MTAPTHRYTGTGLRRGTRNIIQPGEKCHPTDAELRAFGDCFEPLPDAEQPDDDPADDPDSEAEPDADDGPAETEGLTLPEARHILEEAGIDADDYRALQSAASEYDGIEGNLPKSELQSALAEAIRAE